MDNRDEFIREITLRICSSLEIKESLRSAFEYLREHVPLDMLALFILDERLGAIRHIAHADENVALPPHLVPLPEGMAEKIAARNYSAPFVVDAGEDEFFRTLSPLVGLEGYTDLIVPLRIRGELLGGLALRARGEGRYSEEHAELLGRLGTPFAVALANSLAHEEVLRYQAILLDDKRFLIRELYGGAADEILGGNTRLRNVMEMVRQVAPLNNTVLILGETGTGKEVIADAIHFSSPRRNGPFIKVNCGALPENLTNIALKLIEKGKGFIFPSEKGKLGHITQDALSQTVNRGYLTDEVIKVVGHRQIKARKEPYFGMKPWSPHDLRRTARTNTARVRHNCQIF